MVYAVSVCNNLDCLNWNFDIFSNNSQRPADVPFFIYILQSCKILSD
jgi:hypothetical protein